MKKNIHYFVSFITLFCSFAQISCDTLNNVTFVENDLFNENSPKIVKLSDNRFNGVFEWGYDEDFFGCIFNGTNIVEEYYLYVSKNTDEKLSDSSFYEYDLNNGKYRKRLIINNEYVGEWENWLDYNFSDDCNILILQHETLLEILEKYPHWSPTYFVDYNKIK
jgi:hypothetical protein